MDWENVHGFQGLDHYTRVERSICEAIWDGAAELLLEPEFREPELKGVVLPYSKVYLVVHAGWAVWRLIQPGEKGGGSFLHLGVVKPAYRDSWLPIRPEQRKWLVGTYIDVFDIHKREDLWTRLENAPDAPDIEYEN